MAHRVSLLYSLSIYLVNGVSLFILLFDSRMRFCFSGILSYYWLSFSSG